MEHRTLSPLFLHAALRETRRMRNASKVLEEDIQMLHEEIMEDDEDENFLGEDNLSVKYHLDCLEALVDEHASYQDYLIKDIYRLSHLIPSEYISHYFSLVHEFDKAVHTLDSDYLVL